MLHPPRTTPVAVYDLQPRRREKSDGQPYPARLVSRSAGVNRVFGHHTSATTCEQTSYLMLLIADVAY